jgi:quercetin dioxygenase-like cupin family protein
VKLLALTLMTLSLVFTIAVIAQTPQSKSSVAVVVPEQTRNAMQIMRDGSQQITKGPAANFTGSAQVKPLVSAHYPSRATAGQVTFDPGSRSAWHTHPLGQALIVTEGAGWVQQWGGVVQQIRKGDVVWTPPGVKHWHGATPNTSMTHITVQEELGGKNVEWMEKVSDEQYHTEAQQPR